MGDTGNGFLAAIAICQALYEREKTGRGQWVETAIVNAQLLNASHSLGRPDGSGFSRPQRDAMHLGFSAGVRLYPTQDGWICLSLVRDSHWHALGSVLSGADFQPGGQFSTEAARDEQDETISKQLEKFFAEKTTAGCL